VGALHGGYARDALARIGEQAPPDPNIIGALQGGHARDAMARLNQPVEEKERQWKAAWDKLPPGGRMIGLDGQLYVKKG
jgi:hypothetical protein